MNILFVIKMIDFGDYVSVSYLSAIAKNKGHNVYICILDNNDIFEMMAKIKPEIVAYSANLIGYDEMVFVNKQIKKQYDFISIMGGPQPTFSPELFNDSTMDVFCIGEGELPFKDFLEKIEVGESFDNIPNLITKNKVNPIRPLIDNLNDIPLPDRSLTIENSFLKDISKKSVFTSRGCPYSCSYCCNSYYKELYKGKGKIYRRFSVDRIIDELKSMKEKYNMDFVKIGDDLFALKVDPWLMEFVDKYKKEIDLPFNCYLRLDTVNDELLTVLKEAGCFSVHLSIDSCSKHVREKVFNRKWMNIDMQKKLLMIRKHGIRTWVNFMLSAPESTLKDDFDTIKLARIGKISHLNFSTTIPIKNTALFNYCVTHSLVDDSYIGNMAESWGRSPLLCFSEREKDIRYNIFCLGMVASKVPQPFSWIIIQIIKYIPSNRLFKKIHDWYWNYSVKNIIFKIKK